METAQMSISRRVDKTNMGHLHNGILLDYRKKENFTFCNSMYVPGEYYAKWNKPTEKENIIWFHSYVESKEQTELTSKIETDSKMENKWQLVGQKGGGGIK